MITLAAWPVMAAIWTALRSSPMLWLAVAGSLLVGVGAIKVRGIVHDRAVAKEAAATERAAADVRRLKAQLDIMTAYTLRGNRIIAARTEDLDRQREESNQLESELARLRHASTADPRTPVIDGNDPWLRGRTPAAARNPATRGR